MVTCLDGVFTFNSGEEIDNAVPVLMLLFYVWASFDSYFVCLLDIGVLEITCQINSCDYLIATHTTHTPIIHPKRFDILDAFIFYILWCLFLSRLNRIGGRPGALCRGCQCYSGSIYRLPNFMQPSD